MSKLSYEEKIKIYEERKQGRTANSLAKKYEDDLREHSNKVRNLKKKIKTRDDRIEELEYDLNDKDILDGNDIDIIQNNLKNNEKDNF